MSQAPYPPGGYAYGPGQGYQSGKYQSVICYIYYLLYLIVTCNYPIVCEKKYRIACPLRVG